MKAPTLHTHCPACVHDITEHTTDGIDVLCSVCYLVGVRCTVTSHPDQFQIFLAQIFAETSHSFHAAYGV